MIAEYIERAKQAELEGKFCKAGLYWTEAAKLADARKPGGAGRVYRRLAEACEIKFENRLTNHSPSGMVGTERETVSTKKETETVAVVVAPTPTANVKGSVEERLFGATLLLEEEEGPYTDLEVTEEADFYVIRIPKTLPVAALTQRMGRGERPTGLVYAPLRMKGVRVGFEGEGPNGKRTTHLTSKRTEFQLSFRLG